MRGVLGKHRGGDGAATRERGQRLARHQRLASKNAVLIGERQPYDFKLVLFDDGLESPGGFFLLLGPETVALHKIQRATSGCAITPPPRDGEPGRRSLAAPAPPMARYDAA